jgi:CheY-like chemotaxis protein
MLTRAVLETVPVILLAEDQPNDVLLTRLAIETAGLPNPLFAVGDGQDAVAYLDGNGPYANRKAYPLPSLFLLDLKMPLMGGFEVLIWLQRRPRFDDIAVVVLSSSNIVSDIDRAKSLGADDYRV